MSAPISKYVTLNTYTMSGFAKTIVVPSYRPDQRKETAGNPDIVVVAILPSPSFKFDSFASRAQPSAVYLFVAFGYTSTVIAVGPSPSTGGGRLFLCMS